MVDIPDVYQTILQSGSAYEGASQKYRQDMQTIFTGSTDQILARELLILQLRSLHAIRNNGYAKIARDKYLTNLGSLKVIWHDAKNRKHTKMQDLWDEFAESPSLDGLGTLDNIQSLWHSSIFSTGNAFTRKQIRRRPGRKVPLYLEPIQSELHDIFYFGTGRVGDTTRNGIRFVDSVPQEYYFRLSQYQEFPTIANTQAVSIIPASEILHIFNRELPGQWLGVPMLSSVLIPLYELDELMDSTVARQKASQAISWIITNSNPTNMAPVGSAIIDKSLKEPKVVFRSTGSNVQYLNKGEGITFHQGADIGNNFVKLAELELRRISNACHVPYHQLTGDTAGINFSTLRALLIELRSRIEYTHHFLTIPMGLGPLTKAFQEIVSLYVPAVRNAIPSFQLPRFYGVDDLKDAQADVLEIQNGLATLDSKLQERHTTFESIAADRERIKELGLDNLLFPNGNPMAQANNTQANPNSSSN